MNNHHVGGFPGAAAAWAAGGSSSNGGQQQHQQQQQQQQHGGPPPAARQQHNQQQQVDTGVVYDTYLLPGSRSSAPQHAKGPSHGGGRGRQERGNAGECKLAAVLAP